MNRLSLFKSVSILGLIAVGTPLFAQETPATAGADTAQPEETIVVTGQRASLRAAAKIKQNSANVVDSIVSDDIGKFPDRTVAGALQRVPGVQINVGTNNEIVNPIIRGLGDIMTTLDGREIFTGVGRGFSYQDLPAEALAGADVYKTSSAELIEGGVVGVINLRLHKPFDFKDSTVAASARAIYSGNTKKLSPVVSLLGSTRWETGMGEMGALANLSYSNADFNRPVAFNCDFRSGNHGANPVVGGSAGIAAPTCVGGLNNEGNYRRVQGNAAFQWKPTSDLTLDLTGLYTAYRSKWASNFLIADIFGGTFSNVTKTSDCQQYNVAPDGFHVNPGQPSASETLCTAGSLVSTNHGGFTSAQAHSDKTDIYLVAGGATYRSGPLTLKGDVSYQHSLVRNQNFILDIFKAGGGLTTTVFNFNKNGGTNYATPGLSDPTNFALSPLNQDNIRDTGEQIAGQIDGKYAIDGFVKNIQFGARYADHKATHQQALRGVGAPAGTLVSSVGFLPSDFLIPASGIPGVNGGYGVIVPNQNSLRDPALQDKLRAFYGLAAGWPAFQPERAFAAEEKTASAYLQLAYEFPIGAISVDGLVGGRYTNTKRTISGAALNTPAATPGNPNPAKVVVPFTASTEDNDFLPNASARLRFGGGVQARLSYAKAVARPDFGALNPGTSYQLSTNVLILPSGNGGNANLRPQKSDSFDATLEYYFGRDNYISIAGYYKKIKDRVVAQSQVERIDGVDYNIVRPRNLAKATLKGIEIAGQAFFDFLPGDLSGLGAMANFTLADGKINVDQALAGQRLGGVSKYNYNVGLLYEKAGWTGRVVYNHRSGYYDELYRGTTIRPAAAEKADVLNQVRAGGRLDASIGYEVRPGMTISLDGTNLLKNHYRSAYGRTEFARDERYDDRTVSFGVSAKF